MAGFPKTGDEYGGRYRITRELGHGGMGIVYEAVDSVLNRSVALKIVLPSLPDREDFQARFAREASVLARIRSRHVVGIHEYGEHDDTVYFVTELFPDGDLQHWLQSNGPLDRRDALLLVAQVCEALADAHTSGVIHRDVKPGNVLLWKRSEGLIPYLCDFGIAIDGQEGLTRTGALVGSPAYMAPERHFGRAADERGDVYSVGCLLWAVLTGDAPYSGTDFQMMNSHINEPTPQLGTGHPVDQRIDEVLVATLQKDPEQRLGTAEEVRQRLLTIVGEVDAQVAGAPAGPVEPEEMPVGATQGSEPEPHPDAIAPSGDAPGENRRRGPWLLVAALVLALVGGVATAVALLGDGDAATTAPEPTTSADAETTPDEETVALPPTPDPPRVSAASKYRSVVFAAAAPRYRESADLSLEYHTGDGWEPTRRKVTVETEMGGARACARFRSLATGDDGTQSTSRAVRECGSAQPPTVEFIRSEDPCVNSIGGPCTWYDVRVSGFRSSVTPLVSVRRVNGEPWCVGCDYDRIEVGADGRGYLRHDWKISRDEGQVILDVAGVTREFHVFY